MAAKKRAKKKVSVRVSISRRKRKPVKTLVSLLLDESGSMGTIWDATIQGFNGYIKELQADKNAQFYMTLTQFDSIHHTPVFVGKPIKDVPLLSRESYKPGQSTPLYDAIGKTIKATEEWLAKEPNAAVVFVIQTDGYENASNEFRLDAIKARIAEKTKQGWTFAYLGAGPDSWAGGNALGIPQTAQCYYAHTAAGTNSATTTLSSATRTYAEDVAVFGMGFQKSSFFSDPKVLKVDVQIGGSNTSGSK